MLLVGYCCGVRSERRRCDEIHLNLAYRWFCRLDLADRVPDQSTFSKNRHGRFRDCDLLYRLGLTRAKHFALTGCSLSGKEAVDAGLINFSYPQAELEDKVWEYVNRLAQIPATQLAAMKFITNQVFDRQGVEHSALLGPILDGIMRNTKESDDFVRTAKEQGVGAAVALRDGPFGDYSQGPAATKPNIYGKA